MTSAEFEAISPGLPSHQAEGMAAHGGQPSIVVQSATHGAPLPEPDLGIADDVKYANGGC